MKTLGWVLLVVGLLGTFGAWQYGYGTTSTIVMLVVAVVGAWLAFRGNGASGSM